MNTLVSVNNLSRYYGKFCAVDAISFTIQRGQIVGFLGANGAGKSTTMQMLAGTLAPSHGAINIAGHNLLTHPVAAKSAIGYLPENPPLYQDMRVNEFLSFCAQLHGLSGKTCKQAVDHALDMCGLTAVARRLIMHLSKGYQQRVGIAQAILHAPEVLILDEPTVGLDPLQIKEIRDLIQQLGQAHSVIISTHILPEVQSLCTDVQIIHAGKLQVQLSMDELQQHSPISSIKVGLKTPPDQEKLMQLTGAVKIDTLPNNYLRIHYASQNTAITEKVLHHAQQQQWGLFALIPEQGNLEQLFINVTCADKTQ